MITLSNSSYSNSILTQFSCVISDTFSLTSYFLVTLLVVSLSI